VTGLRAWRARNQCSIPGRIFSPCRPPRLRGSRNFLYNGHRRIFHWWG
jgi:hypothetical protein